MGVRGLHLLRVDAVYENDKILHMRAAERQKKVAVELVNELCPKDCFYRVKLDDTTDYCAYCVIEYEPRRCKISECDKYKRGKRKVVLDKYTLECRWVEYEEL